MTGPAESGTVDGVLSLGETWTYTYYYDATQSDINNNGIDKYGVADNDGDIDNEATFTDNFGTPKSDPAEVPIARDINWTIDKTASVPGGSVDVAGETITYTVVIANIGNVDLSGSLVDSLPGIYGMTGPAESGTVDGVLSLGETWTYTYYYDATQSDINNNGIDKYGVADNDGDIDNEATFTDNFGTPKSDPAEVPIAQNVNWTIDKTASVPGGSVDVAGETITYTVVIANIGNVDLTGSLVDSLPGIYGMTGPAESGTVDGVLSLGETWTYTYYYDATQSDINNNGIDKYGVADNDGDIDNEATFTDNFGTPKSDPAEVPVVQPQQCTGCLKICKYEDKNGNGQKDSGEPYLSGWEFTITNNSGYSKSVTTAGGSCGCSCDYCVTTCDLAAGEYTITETLKAGWTCTTGNPRTVTVECDKTTTVKFGNQKPCSGCLKIYKYNDKNGNGQKDCGEAYLSGWTFNVTDSQGNSQSVTTGTGGYVTICNLLLGQYTITETLKAGWTCTTGNPRTVTVGCDKTTTVKFGNQKPCSGCLKIYKYNDKNGNGRKDCREAYLSGWTFNVTDSQGNSQLVTTNSGGYVTICNLAPGVYNVTETLKAGWTCTTGNPLNNVTVVSGKTTTVYFGNKQ
jgi:uncharacterized repeat protein (TIGR01451 family)